MNLSQQEISKLILKLIEKQNVNYLKLMNWNLFRYLVQVIGDPTTSETLQKDQDMEESSIYTRQKVKKKETKNKSRGTAADGARPEVDARKGVNPGAIKKRALADPWNYSLIFQIQRPR